MKSVDEPVNRVGLQLAGKTICHYSSRGVGVGVGVGVGSSIDVPMMDVSHVAATATVSLVGLVD
jgi:hypothetical protein